MSPNTKLMEHDGFQRASDSVCVCIPDMLTDTKYVIVWEMLGGDCKWNRQDKKRGASEPANFTTVVLLKKYRVKNGVLITA